MVITITMKNYVIRNGIYYFRLAVPKDCQAEAGKREILQSLKTSEELEAAVAIDKLTKTDVPPLKEPTRRVSILRV